MDQHRREARVYNRYMNQGRPRKGCLLTELLPKKDKPLTLTLGYLTNGRKQACQIILHE